MVVDMKQQQWDYQTFADKPLNDDTESTEHELQKKKKKKKKSNEFPDFYAKENGQ